MPQDARRKTLSMNDIKPSKWKTNEFAKKYTHTLKGREESRAHHANMKQIKGDIRSGAIKKAKKK